MTESLSPLSLEQAGTILEGFYKKYHKPEFIDPDPLIFPRRYGTPADAEAAAFIASSFALGRVAQILSFLERLFGRLGSPRDGLIMRSEADIENDFSDLLYRFYSASDIAAFLKGLRGIYLQYGSIEDCFIGGGGSIEAGMNMVASAVNSKQISGGRNVVASPEGGSACKRFMLFLRWVIRNDDIDLGLWEMPPSKLLIPLDTHVMKVSRFLGLTRRGCADIRTVRDITANLKIFDKEDPVKYDFSMSRIGIHPDLSYSELESEILI